MFELTYLSLFVDINIFEIV